MKLRTIFFCSAFCLTAVLSGMGASLPDPVVLLADDFTLPAGKLPGDEVRFNTVPEGSLLRKYCGQNVISYYDEGGNGYFGSSTDSRITRRLYVPINKEDLPGGYSVLRCEMTLNADLMSSLLVGFSGSDEGIGVDLSKNGQLWLDINYKGDDSTFYALCYGSTSIASGSVAGHGPLDYMIEYDFEKNVITAVSVGGTAAIENFDLNKIGYTPEIRAFQFQFGSIKPEAKGKLIGDNLRITAVR